MGALRRPWLLGLGTNLGSQCDLNSFLCIAFDVGRGLGGPAEGGCWLNITPYPSILGLAGWHGLTVAIWLKLARG